MKPPTAAPPQYRPEIDGLRALAVSAVVCLHAGLHCPGGFIGVDVFFVISGFLIGGILLRELAEGTFSFARFWERRVRRIVPAALGFFSVTLLAGTMVLSTHEMARLGSETAWSLAGLANFKMDALTGVEPVTLAWLIHIWSLAVEEQFYLLMPLLLAFSQRWLRGRTFAVLLGLFAASFFLSAYWSQSHNVHNFYLLPGRAWELLLGCMGAWALQNGLALPRPLREPARALGALGIVAAALLIHDAPNWPDQRAIFPACATLLALIATGDDPSPTYRFLSLPPLRFIGLISYSLYLYHWPLVVYFINFEGGATAPVRYGVVGASVVLAALSWRFVERPLRNRAPGRRVEIRPLLAGAGALWAALMAVSLQLSGMPTATAEGRMAPPFFNTPGYSAIAAYDATDIVARGGVMIGAGAGPPQCVILGDSQAMALGPAMASLCQEYHVKASFLCGKEFSAVFGNDDNAGRTHPQARPAQDAAVQGWLAKWKPPLVVVAADWTHERQARDGGGSPQHFAAACGDTLAWLAARAGTVAVIRQVPSLPFDANAARTIWHDYTVNTNKLPRFEESPKAAAARRDAFDGVVGPEWRNVRFVDPAPFFLSADGAIRYSGANGILYFDGGHLNPLGSMELKPLLEPFFKEISPAAN